MKLLIIGIDGLGTENIETFGLHRLKRRMSAGQSGAVTTAHRISRGWCEIYSGTTAKQSGAYYQIGVQAPDGRILPSQKTGIDQVEKTIGAENMLWNRLEQMGYRMSVMTVPTITAPRDMAGFSIGATGGGKFGNGVAPDDLFPQDLLRDVMIDDLDLGLRMGYGGFLPSSLAQLEAKVDKHLKDFAEILKVSLERRPCDALFLGTRVLTEMAYKFTALVQSDPTDSSARALRETVLSLSDRFDAMIDRVIEDLAPDNLFVVSDHGIRTLNAEINLNEALVEMGILRRDTLRQMARYGARTYKRLRSKTPRSRIIPNIYRFERSSVFSIGYIDALYLTDARFGGPNLTHEARIKQATETAERVSDYWTKKAPGLQLQFSATGDTPYSGGAETPEAGGVPNPDILCHTPEGVVNLKQNSGLYDKPIFDFGEKLFRTGFPGEFSATKSNDTYAGYLGPHGDVVGLTKLTDLYGAILAVAERAK